MCQQRSLAEVMEEFLGLQIVQNEVALEVTHNRQLLQMWRDGMERSKHNRDSHHGSWDMEFSLKYEKKYEDKAQEAEKKFRVNQNRLKELKDGVVSRMMLSH